MSDDQSPRHPALAAFVREHAITEGRFVLASGRESNYYCDGKKVSFHGEGVALIADAILQEIEDLRIDAVGGMDMGATPIVSAVAMRSFQLGQPIPTFVVRKQAKEHGTQKKTEGLLPDAPARIVLIEDVVTTGGSIIRAIETVRELGHDVVLVISVLDRESGGAEALAKVNVPYQPLVTVSEIGLAEQLRT